jgi:hypothetical protein
MFLFKADGYLSSCSSQRVVPQWECESTRPASVDLSVYLFDPDTRSDSLSGMLKKNRENRTGDAPSGEMLVKIENRRSEDLKIEKNCIQS